MTLKQLQMLAVVATDATFEARQLDGRAAWVGKCIHCAAKLVVDDRGVSIGQATLEHIWPRTQGGDGSLANIAIACARCNREKGRRHDHRGGERLEAVVERLRARRRQRWRELEASDLGLRIAPRLRAAALI